MKARPYVILNMASTIDGRIALRGKKPIKLSSEDDFARVHRLRSECQAVLVGVETVLADDPKLTVKEEVAQNSRNPLRIVLDSQGRLPDDSAVLDGSAQTLVVTSEECTRTFPGAEVLRCGVGKVDLHRLLLILGKRGIEKLLVEGGGTVAWSFLKEGLVDVFQVYMTPAVMGDTMAPSLFTGAVATTDGDLIRMRLQEVEVLGDGVLLTLKPEAQPLSEGEDEGGGLHHEG
ncbi:MAG: 2,5-diamino-6-(ribosylamino)-4(3H)-pyrimidinone 5'-phosphate reductase [Thermoplasmata archaeon]